MTEEDGNEARREETKEETKSEMENHVDKGHTRVRSGGWETMVQDRREKRKRIR